MDRRQRKTREAIFSAFIGLLSKKNFNQITVGEIIERADVGRATFYSHFETKDFLLRELCRELFDHIFEADLGVDSAHEHIFDCDAQGSVFLHLLQHLRKNDNNILELFASENNELFLGYFKENLKKLVKQRMDLFEGRVSDGLPTDFKINHIASTFVETVRWWTSGGLKESPETITKYFFLAV